jgi:hypothetical protein
MSLTALRYFLVQSVGLNVGWSVDILIDGFVPPASSCRSYAYFSAASTTIFPSPPATEQFFFWSALCCIPVSKLPVIVLIYRAYKCSVGNFACFSKNRILNGIKEDALPAIVFADICWFEMSKG